MHRIFEGIKKVFQRSKKKGSTEVEDIKEQKETGLLKMKEIILLRKAEGETSTEEEKKNAEKIMAVFRQHLGLLEACLNFLSRKAKIGRVVLPTARRAIYGNDSKGSIEIEWPIGYYPVFSVRMGDLKAEKRIWEYSEQELDRIEDFFQDSNTDVIYAGPGPVLDFEELIGSPTERKISRKIEKMLKRKRHFDIDASIARFRREAVEREDKNRMGRAQEKQLLENCPNLKKYIEEIRKNMQEQKKDKWGLGIKGIPLPVETGSFLPVEDVWLMIVGLYSSRDKVHKCYIVTSLFGQTIDEEPKEVFEFNVQELGVIETFLSQGKKETFHNGPMQEKELTKHGFVQ